jgi:tripartite-type tricarboxylate transporter receptor subunit TctC
MRRPVSKILIVFLMAPFILSNASAEDFFKGKTITMSTHVAPGDGYDTYLRLLSRHYSRHIPGAPTIIVANQPGAGGLYSINYAAKRAPQDGTWIVLASQGLYLHEALEKPGLEASLRDFKWIGNMNSSANVTATWRLSGVKTIDDARKKEVTVGSTGAGAITSIVPAIMNSILGTKFKIIYGFQGGAAQNLAMERGEIDGRSVNTWDGYKAIQPNAIANGDLHILVQISMHKEPDLPHVPRLVDLVQGDPEKEAIARFLSQGMSISRSIAAPPATPEGRVSLLRSAFDNTMIDSLFRAEAAKLGAEISPFSGVHVQQVVEDVVGAPLELRRKVSQAAKE